MWKLILILIVAIYLFGNVSSSETEIGGTEAFFGEESFSTSPDIWPSERSTDAPDETTLLPRSDFQTESAEAVSAKLGRKLDEMVSNLTLQGQESNATLHGQQKSSVQNAQENYPQLKETEREVADDSTDLSGFISRGDISGNSTNIDESNETADSKVWRADVSKNLTSGSSVFERTVRNESPARNFDNTSDESLATGTVNTNDFSVRENERPTAGSRNAASGRSDGETEATTVFARSIENPETTPGLDQTFPGESDFFPASPTTKSFPRVDDDKSFTSANDGFTSANERITNGESSSTGHDELINSNFQKPVYPSATGARKNFESTSEDTVHDNIDEQNFTEKSNSSPSISSTGQKVSVSSELSLSDVKEINPSEIAESESSLIYNGENDTFEHTPQDNNTPQIISVSGESPFVENSASTVSPEDSDKLTTRNLFSYDVTPPNSVAKTNPYLEENFEETSNVSSSNDTELFIFDIPKYPKDDIPEDTELPPSKPPSNETYKLILTGKCSGSVMMPQIFQTLYSIFNTRLDARNSTRLTKCRQEYEFNFSPNVASSEAFEDALGLVMEKLGPVHAKIMNYDSEVYEIPPNSGEDSENFVIPKLLVYISAGVTGLLIMFMILFVLCLRKKCKRSSTSVDLSDIPHLTLGVDDYKLSPIPRPSVSLRDGNRDFLYAYSNETYNRTREDDAVLSQQHFSNNGGKEFNGLKAQKNRALALEMQTFNAGGGQRSEMKSGHEYATPYGWDRRKLKENGKKQIQDNTASRW